MSIPVVAANLGALRLGHWAASCAEPIAQLRALVCWLWVIASTISMGTNEPPLPRCMLRKPHLWAPASRTLTGMIAVVGDYQHSIRSAKIRLVMQVIVEPSFSPPRGYAMTISARKGEEIWEFFRRMLPIVQAHERVYFLDYKGTRIEATPSDDHDSLYEKWRRLRK